MKSSPFICRTGSGPRHPPEPRRNALKRSARRLPLLGAACSLASVVFCLPPSPRGHPETGRGSLIPFPASPVLLAMSSPQLQCQQLPL